MASLDPIAQQQGAYLYQRDTSIREKAGLRTTGESNDINVAITTTLHIESIEGEAGECSEPKVTAAATAAIEEMILGLTRFPDKLRYASSIVRKISIPKDEEAAAEAPHVREAISPFGTGSFRTRRRDIPQEKVIYLREGHRRTACKTIGELEGIKVAVVAGFHIDSVYGDENGNLNERVTAATVAALEASIKSLSTTSEKFAYAKKMARIAGYDSADDDSSNASSVASEEAGAGERLKRTLSFRRGSHAARPKPEANAVAAAPTSHAKRRVRFSRSTHGGEVDLAAAAADTKTHRTRSVRNLFRRAKAPVAVVDPAAEQAKFATLREFLTDAYAFFATEGGKHLKVEGIFRLSAGHELLGRAVELSKQGKKTDEILAELEIKGDHAILISATIKKILRDEIARPISLESFRTHFGADKDGDQLAPEMKRLFAEWEPEKQEFFKELLQCLSEVAKQSDENKMTPDNLAITVAPNLFETSDDMVSELALTNPRKDAIRAFIEKTIADPDWLDS